MVSLGIARALLRTLWNAAARAVNPEGAADASTLRAFAAEAVEANLLVVRWQVLLLVPMHALIMVVFLRFRETDPRRADWIAWIIIINAVLLAGGLLGASLSWRRWPAFLVGFTGDFGGALYILGGAATSANAQRAHPNINVFILCAILSALQIRMRPRIYVLSLLTGSTLVLLAMERFQPDAASRAADTLSLGTVTALSLLAFFVTRGMRFRELDARHQIQQLNAQLNEKIRGRSRELSMALARLAAGHRELDPGTLLGGRFELHVPIGRGGMGVVYRGCDQLTERAVAIKVVQAGSTHELDALHRFLREAQIVASITHDAIVRSLHVDVSEDGQLFQVMELVEGETLASRLARQGPLPPPTAARLGAVLAAALAAAHQARVVHLDVKPGNVILTRTAPGLKLLDFGISRLRDVRAIQDGAAGRILGTPEFLSPEQVIHPERVDERADVYALGLVLYLAIAGRMPFDAASPPSWALAHTQHPPVDIGTLVPAIDPELTGLVMSCLDKDPGARPAAASLAAALAALADRANVPPLQDLSLVASVLLAPLPGPSSAVGPATQPSPLEIEQSGIRGVRSDANG